MILSLLKFLTVFLLPDHRKDWGRAMQAEIENIPSPLKAHCFALACLLACFRFRLEKYSIMLGKWKNADDDRFTTLSTVSGLTACAIGFVYLSLAGAPTRMILVNGGATIIGIILFFVIKNSLRTTNKVLTLLTVIGSLILIATAIFGYAASDTRRWVLIGPFFIQTSLMFLPAMMVCYAKIQNAWTTLAIMIAALAMAIQPDRAMAGMVCLAALVIICMRVTKLTTIAAIICTMMFALTLILPDRLPAVPYVDHIIWTAFEINLATGLLLWFGCLLILCPIWFLANSERSISQYVFATSWFALIAASAMGAYPTPLVGYGFSAIIGYFVSLALVHPLFERNASIEPVNMQDTQHNNQPLQKRKVQIASA